MSAVHSEGQDVRSNRPGIASPAALFTAEMKPFDRQLISSCRQLWVRPAQQVVLSVYELDLRTLPSEAAPG